MIGEGVTAGLRPEVREGRRSLLLVTAGVTVQGLLALFVLLYVNFPEGHNAPFGLSLESKQIFSQMWAYPSLSLAPGVFGGAAIAVILALWGVYLLTCVGVQRWASAAGRERVAWTIGAFAVIYNAVLVLAMPPVLSVDIYHYALFGRMEALYGLNPYAVPGTAISGDPFYQIAYWRDVTSHYGPVWTLISAGAAALGGHSVLLTVLAFKGLAALFNLGNCLLVFLLARRLTGGDGVGALLLYAWNPLILIETAGSGHNDAVMMTFALLGVLLAARGRLLMGLAVLLLSVMVKYITAILVLFFIARCLVRQDSWRKALLLAGRMGAVAVAFGALYLPFWAGPQTLMRLAEVGSPFKSIVRALLRDGVAGALAGAGVENTLGVAETIVLWGLNVGFALLVLAFLAMVVGSKADWPRVLELWGVASLVYVFVVYGWNFPWYLIPAMATAFVGGPTSLNRRLRLWSMGIGLGLMLLYAVPIRV